MPTKDQITISAIHARISASEKRLSELAGLYNVIDTDLEKNSDKLNSFRNQIFALHDDLEEQKQIVADLKHQIDSNSSRLVTEIDSLKKDKKLVWGFIIFSIVFISAFLYKVFHG